MRVFERVGQRDRVVHMQKKYKRNEGHFTELGRAAWLLYDLKKDTYRNDWVLLESS